MDSEPPPGPPVERVPAKVYVILAVGLVSISFSPILVRLATDAPGLAIAAWRTVFAALIVAPFAVVRLVRRPPAAVDRCAALSVLGAAVFLSLHFILWIESLYHTSVASASVLVSTTPIFLGILGYLLLRERLKRAVIVAIAIGVSGAALIAVGDTGSTVAGNSSLGNGLALAASLAAAFYLLIGSIVRRRMEWLTYVASLYVLVALFVVALAVSLGTPLFGHDPTFYALCLGMAVGPQVLGHGSFNYVIRYISPTLLSLLILMEPVVSSVLAFMFFGEMPGVLAVGGMLLVLVSILLAVIPLRKR